MQYSLSKFSKYTNMIYFGIFIFLRSFSMLLIQRLDGHCIALWFNNLCKTSHTIQFSYWIVFISTKCMIAWSETEHDCMIWKNIYYKQSPHRRFGVFFATIWIKQPISGILLLIYSYLVPYIFPENSVYSTNSPFLIAFRKSSRLTK